MGTTRAAARATGHEDELAGAEQAEVQGPLWLMLQLVEEEVGVAHELATVLDARLAPLLGPSRDTAEGGGMASDDDRTSDLVRRLADLRRTQQQLNARLSEWLERLEA